MFIIGLIGIPLTRGLPKRPLAAPRNKPKIPRLVIQLLSAAATKENSVTFLLLLAAGGEGVSPFIRKFDTVECAIHHVHMDSWEFRVRCKECMSVLVTLTMAEAMLTASFVEIALENHPDSLAGDETHSAGTIHGLNFYTNRVENRQFCSDELCGAMRMH